MPNTDLLATARDAFVRAYAERSGVTVEYILQHRVAVPARLDRCDLTPEECGGWHMLPRKLYTTEDVRVGFISQELLDWIEGRLP